MKKSRAKEFLDRARAESKGLDGSGVDGLDGLEALAEFFDSNNDSALERLSGKTDPQSIRSKLVILSRLARYQEAVELIANLPRDERWCDVAIAVLVRNGNQEQAKSILEWTRLRPDPMLHRRCLMQYVDSIVALAAENPFETAQGNRSIAGRIRDELLQEARGALEPLLQLILSNGRIDTPFEEIVALQGLLLSRLQFEHERVRQLTTLLSTRRPIPMGFVRLVLRHLAPPPPGLAAQLRSDYPNAFEPLLCAAIVESDFDRKSEEAFSAALALEKKVTTAAQKERLCFALIDLSARVVREKRQDLIATVSRLLEHDARLLSLAQAILALRSGDLDSAAAAIEMSKDKSDPRWLQVWASFRLESGDQDGAIRAYEKAASIAQHPDLYRVVAELAYRQSNFTGAKAALEELLRIDAADIEARKNLAAIYAQLGEFAEAAKMFKVLCEEFPTNETFRLNHAICLARSNDLDSSLEAYNSVCSFPHPRLEAIAGRAEVLKALGRAEEAFESLKSFKDEFQGDFRFLLGYMESAYAAGDEDAAHEALVLLQQLKTQGKVPETAMQEHSVDKVVQLIGEENDRNALVHRNLLEGKMSWLLIEKGLRRGVYWGWRLRTQQLAWLGEDPLYRAQYSVYATNHVHPKQDVDGATRLRQIDCPPAGHPIVCDLSALITLHRLGLLNEAATYFGQILVPATYLSYALDEAMALVTHQRSKRTSAEQICDAIDAQRIGVVSANDLLPTVNEHTHEKPVGSGWYRLRDIVNDLKGHIPDPLLVGLAAIARHPATADSGAAPLPAGGTVRFALSTLETIATRGLLDAVLQRYKVVISSEDRDELSSRVRELSAREEVRTWQAELWKRIRKDNRFIQLAHPPLEGRHMDESSEEVPFAGLLLARERELPLLVDDRMVQVLLLNERRHADKPAFGTDALILRLMETGALTPLTSAQHMMTLARWRYRFIVPEPEMLKALADNFRSKLPGKDLQDFATYVQDCMRDPGLLSGPEQTDPPVPIAGILYQTWLGCISEFIVDVWQDKTYATEEATALTKWAINELLPSIPDRIPPHLQASLANATARMVLGRAIIHSARSQDIERASDALQAIAEAFHLNIEAYLEIVTGVIDAADPD